MNDNLLHRSAVAQLACFVALACLYSWLCWLPLAMVGPHAAPATALRYLHLAGSLGPAVSAFVMTGLLQGRAGVRGLIKRVVAWRIHWWLHAIAWLSPFALLLAAQVLARAMGDAVAIGSLERSAEYANLPVPVYWLAVLVFYGFGEEIGWRGFILALLQRSMTPFGATLIIIAIWALWHWPLFLFSPGLSSLGPAGGIGWILSLATGAFILTALVNAARGSILVAAAFHATMDIAFLGDGTVMMVVGAATTIFGCLALVVVLRQRPQWHDVHATNGSR